MLLSEIAARLVGKVGGYAIDRAVMKDNTDTRVCIYEYTGQAPELKFGAAGVKYEHPSFQVVVRGAPTDYDGPRLVAEGIRNDLVTVWTTMLSGTAYNWVMNLNGPFWSQTDAKGRHYFVLNFRTEKAPSA